MTAPILARQRAAAEAFHAHARACPTCAAPVDLAALDLERPDAGLCAEGARLCGEAAAADLDLVVAWEAA